MVSFYLRDFEVQVYELTMRNNGRVTGKFIETKNKKSIYKLILSKKKILKWEITFI